MAMWKLLRAAFDPEGGSPDPWTSDRASVYALLTLTAVAGGLDAIAFISLGGCFLGNQTGNVLLLGISLSDLGVTRIAAHLVSLGSFIAGAAAIGRWTRAVEGDRARARAVLVIRVEATLIAVCALLLWLAAPPPALLVAVLAFSMGMQAGVARRMGFTYLAGCYLTGSTTATMMSSPLGDRSDRWWWHGLLPVLTMAVGAAVTALISQASAPAALGTVAVVSAAVAQVARGPRPPSA